MKQSKEDLCKMYGGWWESECENHCQEITSITFDDDGGKIPWNYDNDLRYICGADSRNGWVGGCGGRITKHIWHKALPEDACPACAGTGKKSNINK